MTEHVSNVYDRRTDGIGTWAVEPPDFARLTAAAVGRTVIYTDHGRAEAGTLKSWGWNGTDPIVWAVYHKGTTAAGAHPDDLAFGVRLVPVEEMMG